MEKLKPTDIWNTFHSTMFTDDEFQNQYDQNDDRIAHEREKVIELKRLRVILQDYMKFLETCVGGHFIIQDLKERFGVLFKDEPPVEFLKNAKPFKYNKEVKL